MWYEKFGHLKYDNFQEAEFNFRVQNFHKPGDIMLTQTLVSTKYAEHLVQTLYKTLAARVNIKKKLDEVIEFNKTHKYVKRGFSLTPLRNSVNFEDNFMNQASALIHIYHDGTIALHHSGIEMGQSLHTKMM